MKAGKMWSVALDPARDDWLLGSPDWGVMERARGMSFYPPGRDFRWDLGPRSWVMDSGIQRRRRR
jgi:hypothetical protein